MEIDRCVRLVRPSLGPMLTRGITRCTGVVNAIPVSGNPLGRKLVESLPYSDLGTRSIRNANCVGSKHRIKHNLMCCLWMEILGILRLQI
jgi:hypothetical protein